MCKLGCRVRRGRWLRPVTPRGSFMFNSCFLRVGVGTTWASRTHHVVLFYLFLLLLWWWWSSIVTKNETRVDSLISCTGVWHVLLDKLTLVPVTLNARLTRRLN